MTLAEFQPQVEAAIVAHEWATARARWRAGLEVEAIAINRALKMVGADLDPEPLRARLVAIERELTQDVTADCVPVHPVRSVPIDIIATAVIRRILRIPASIPVLGIKTIPPDEDVRQAVADIAARWQTPNGSQPDERARVVA